MARTRAQLLMTLGCMMMVVLVLGLLEGLGEWRKQVCVCVCVCVFGLKGVGRC